MLPSENGESSTGSAQPWTCFPDSPQCELRRDNAPTGLPSPNLSRSEGHGRPCAGSMQTDPPHRGGFRPHGQARLQADLRLLRHDHRISGLSRKRISAQGSSRALCTYPEGPAGNSLTTRPRRPVRSQSLLNTARTGSRTQAKPAGIPLRPLYPGTGNKRRFGGRRAGSFFSRTTTATHWRL